MTDIRSDGRLRLLVRVYSCACALVTLPFVPLFYTSLGRQRVHPIPVADGQRRTDGSVVAGERVVQAMRIGDGPWQPAASASIGRQLRSIPPGTRLTYRLPDRFIAGPVREIPRRAGRAGPAVTGALAAVFVLAGTALAAAARSRTADLSAGFLSGAGAALGFTMLEPNVVRIASWPLRNLIIIAVVAVPSGLWAWFLARLISVFPQQLRLSAVMRTAIAGVGVIALARGLLTTWAQIPAAFDPLPWSAQLTILRLFESQMLQSVPFLVGSFAGVALLLRQSRSRDQSDADIERRGRIITVAFAAGCGPALAAIVVQAVALMTTRRQLLTPFQMSLAFLPLVLIPVALTYALLSRRVDSLGVLARRALLFTIARNSIRFLTLAPVAAVAVLLYLHRKEPVGGLLAANPVVSLLAIAGSVAGLRYSDRIHEAIERLFFRERQDARRILRELADAARRASTSGELVETITRDIDNAFHLESIALFVRNPKTQRLVPPPRTSFPSLDITATIARVAERADEPLIIDIHNRNSPFRNLDEMERQWLREGDFRMLVPFVASDGSLLALLGLGEKLSELPFDHEDCLLLSAVAVSGSFALENHILRSSPPLSRAGETAVDDESEAGELARICPICHRLTSPASAARCPTDDCSLVAADVPFLLAGKYRFEQRIGAGGMGVVYRVRDLTLSRMAAVKTLPKLSISAAARFQREARAMATLHHPNVATVFAAESWRGRPMLVCEYLECGTLALRIRQGAIEAARVVEWGIAICTGLEEAHRQGVLHRDIKPSNIGFAASGTAKLLDFGLARFLDDPSVQKELVEKLSVLDKGDGSTATALSTGLVGTPAYLSPEAIGGSPPAPEFDLWSLAVTLYEAVTGHNPFFDVTPVRTLNRVLAGQVPDARELRPGCPPALAILLRDALARDRVARPGTAREFRLRLASCTC